jgi:hypothetical protein
MLKNVRKSTEIWRVLLSDHQDKLLKLHKSFVLDPLLSSESSSEEDDIFLNDQAEAEVVEKPDQEKTGLESFQTFFMEMVTKQIAKGIQID